MRGGSPLCCRRRGWSNGETSLAADAKERDRDVLGLGEVVLKHLAKLTAYGVLGSECCEASVVILESLAGDA